MLNSETNLSSVNLNTKLKHIISHADDLKIANYKISEVENMTKEQQ